MRSAFPRLAATALLLTALACSKSPVEGRYYQGLTWIEFKSDGTVLHGGLGETAEFRVDGQDPQKLEISATAGRTTGRIVNAATIEFPPGESALAQAFQGRWMAQITSSASIGGAEALRDASAVAGQWRIPGETDVLEFRGDHTYRWGPGITGTYTMLGGRRIRMTVVQNGTPSGQMDQTLAVEGDELRLTAPDGAVTKYERVR
jgi:hypothetical protein